MSFHPSRKGIPFQSANRGSNGDAVKSSQTAIFAVIAFSPWPGVQDREAQKCCFFCFVFFTLVYGVWIDREPVAAVGTHGQMHIHIHT